MPIALITGAREGGIAAACADALAARGWDIALGHWAVPEPEIRALAGSLEATGARLATLEADLERADAPAELFDRLEQQLGSPPEAVVACHCRDIQLALMDTPAAELDQHFAVNARSVALLIQQLAHRLRGDDGRVVAFTSDALDQNAPYGISKGALDRVIMAAAQELGPRGIRANAINPGPTETGWIDDTLRRDLSQQTPLGRAGLPADAAHLVAFLLSPEGGWITGQLLHSDGGLG